jgi:Rrf2 family iron-sulfur cluster assembly transcriptional regulator
MRLSAHEEYGLRCLMRLARHERTGASVPLGIPEIAGEEGLSTPHVGKIMRRLRQAGLVRAYRGAHGGYRLVRPPERITLLDALAGMGESSILETPCSDGGSLGCARDDGCTLRVLWGSLDAVLSRLLANVTLADLLGSEASLGRLLAARPHTSQEATA